MKNKIKLNDVGNKYYLRNGETVTINIDGKNITGKIRTEHPNFDTSLVRGEHYYGQIDYYLEIDE